MRRALSFLSAGLLVGAIVTVPCAPCSAQSEGVEDSRVEDSRDEEARSLFEAGRTAFRSGRYEAALRRFRESYELSGRVELLFNIATAADRLRLDQEALDAYVGYVDGAPTGRHSDVARERITFLQAQLSSDSSPASSGARSSDDGDSVAEQWWFWTLIAVLVVGAGVGVGLGVAFSDPQIEDPLPGTVGGVVITLGDL